MDPESHINKNSLSYYANNRGGSITYPSDSGNFLPMSLIVDACCSHGHTWKVPAGNVYDWCMICRLYGRINLPTNTNILACTQNSYVYGQVRFPFVCQQGHICSFIESTTNQGCRTCILQKKIGDNVKIDILRINTSYDKLFRMNCRKQTHDPECTNEECIAIREGSIDSDRAFSADCRNFVPCNRDFYSNAKTNAKSLSLCENDHMYNYGNEIINLMFVLETLLDKRFDYEVGGVTLNVYNPELKMGFIHASDKQAFKVSDSVAKWCSSNDVLFNVIPKDKVTVKTILWYLIEVYMNILPIFTGYDDIETCYQEFKNIIEKKIKSGKRFSNRCVFTINH